MKRRDFFKASSPVLALPLMLNGMSLNAFTRNSQIGLLASQLGAANDNVLVLIQLNGGNDGINTVVPINQLSKYNQVRQQIALPESSLLRLSDDAALHPSMTHIHSMMNNGQGVIIQGVTYPSPNQSHFRATDIWNSGSNSAEYLSSGWAGRYLDTEFPNYPYDYPNATMPDPPALQISAVMSLALLGGSQNMGMALTDPTTFYNLVNGVKGGTFAEPPNTRPGNELRYLRQVEGDSQAYSSTIKAAADRAQNKATYPTGNSLADQLKIVARLIAGGLKTRIYMVSIGGFDTHALQVDPGDNRLGTHATLLGRISSAVGSFHDDLQQLGVHDRVLSMTFSEFGRRVESNASAGTDHGTAAPMFVFGSKVQPGILGTAPNLSDLDSNGNLKLQYDYRQIYASVLSQWLGADQTGLTASLLRDFTQVPLIKSTSTSVDNSVDSSAVLNATVYPNPVYADGTSVRYTLPDGTHSATIRLLDINGRSIALLQQGAAQAGTYTLPIELTHDLANGQYFIDIQAGRYRTMQPLVVQR